jgi:hypothetical protein
MIGATMPFEPRISTRYEMGRQAEGNFRVIEYLKGETLVDRIRRGRSGLTRRCPTLSQSR